MNVAFLSLLAALLAGLGAALAGLEGLRLAAGRVPGSEGWLPPAVLLAGALGAALAGPPSAGARARPLAARVAALAALLVAATGWLLPSGPAAPGRTLPLLLALAPPALLLGALAPLLVGVRDRAGGRGVAPLLAAVLAGLGLGALLHLPLLGSGPPPLQAGALALAAAGALLWVLGLEVVPSGSLDPEGTERGSASRGAPPPAPASAVPRSIPLAARASGPEAGLGPGVDGSAPLPSAVPALTVAVAAGLLLGGADLLLRPPLALAVGSGPDLPDLALASLALGALAGALLLGARRLAGWPAGALWVGLGTLLGAHAPVLAAGWRPASPLPAALLLLGPTGLLGGAALAAATGAARGRAVGRAGSLLAGALVGAGLAALLLRLSDPSPDWSSATRFLGLLGLACACLGGVVALARGPRRIGPVLGVAALLAVGAGLVLGSAPGLPATPPGGARLVERRASVDGVVDLLAPPEGGVQVAVDGAITLTGRAAPLLARRMGRLAAALAPDARRALLVGLDDGQLLAGLAGSSPAAVTALEPRTALTGFGLAGAALSARPALGPEPAVVSAEPVGWLAAHGGWDLIVLSPPRPGDEDELVAERLAAFRRGLAEDGVLVAWLPLQRLSWPAFGAAVGAFLQAFPAATAFTVTPLADQPLVALVGGAGETLPAPEDVDALLARAPDETGPNGMADVEDLYLTDAWGLRRHFREAPAASLADPLPALLGLRREHDGLALAAINVRQLADLAEPLDVAALARMPARQKERIALAAELKRRGEALVALLQARAARLQLARPGVREGDPEQVRDLERRLDGELLAAWTAFPGHLLARAALFERCGDLGRQGDWLEAGTLLEAVIGVQPDAGLAGVLGGVLLRLERVDDALHVLEQARALDPSDRTVLVNLGSALLLAGRDGQAADALRAARATFRDGVLPPLQSTALALLEGRTEALPVAEQLLAGLPPGEPWARCLRRLIAGVAG